MPSKAALAARAAVMLPGCDVPKLVVSMVTLAAEAVTADATSAADASAMNFNLIAIRNFPSFPLEQKIELSPAENGVSATTREASPHENKKHISRLWFNCS